MRVGTLPLITTVLTASLVMTTAAAAQGRGRPKTPRTTTTATSDASSPTSGATTPNFRQFGAWLDDASAPTAREGRAGIGVGYWRLAGGSQIDLPMVDVGYGLNDRLQIGAAVPFYHTTFAGTTYRGLDDVYVSAKYTVLDPTLTESEFGLAVSPVVEMLSAGSPDGRVHVALPVSLELRRQPFRAYGSAGYFTRGSVFAGAALEWTSSIGMVVTGAVNQSYSIKDDSVLDTMGIGRQRVDVMGGVAYPVMNVAAVYVSVGRSLTSIDEGGTSLSLAAGMSFRFHTANATP